MIATIIIRFRFARIATHLVCFATGRETWGRCKAGCAREFNFKRQYSNFRRIGS